MHAMLKQCHHACSQALLGNLEMDEGDRWHTELLLPAAYELYSGRPDAPPCPHESCGGVTGTVAPGPGKRVQAGKKAPAMKRQMKAGMAPAAKRNCGSSDEATAAAAADHALWLLCAPYYNRLPQPHDTWPAPPAQPYSGPQTPPWQWPLQDLATEGAPLLPSGAGGWPPLPGGSIMGGGVSLGELLGEEEEDGQVTITLSALLGGSKQEQKGDEVPPWEEEPWDPIVWEEEAPAAAFINPWFEQRDSSLPVPASPQCGRGGPYCPVPGTWV